MPKATVHPAAQRRGEGNMLEQNPVQPFDFRGGDPRSENKSLGHKRLVEFERGNQHQLSGLQSDFFGQRPDYQFARVRQKRYHSLGFQLQIKKIG